MVWRNRSRMRKKIRRSEDIGISLSIVPQTSPDQTLTHYDSINTKTDVDGLAYLSLSGVAHPVVQNGVTTPALQSNPAPSTLFATSGPENTMALLVRRLPTSPRSSSFEVT